MTNEVFGRPINGDVTRYKTVVEQDDPQLFIDALDAVLAFDGVESVRWTQYTPYFNDGDPCEFSTIIYGGGVKLSFGDPDHGDYENGYYEEFRFYNSSTRSFEPITTINDHDVTALSEAFIVFEEALSNGKHEIFLQQNFGDPAEVTATKEGFDVEFYDHD